MLETAVLGLLCDQDLHGYELKKRLADVLGQWSSVSFGSLYPALARLERDGSVKAVEANTEADAPAFPMSGSLSGEVAAFRGRIRQSRGSRRGRKVYGITTHGRERLAELLRDPTGDDRQFSVRVAFCRHLPAQDRLELFQRRRTDLAARLADRQRGTDTRIDIYLRSLREHHTDTLASELAFLDRLIEHEQRATDGNDSTTGGSPNA